MRDRLLRTEVDRAALLDLYGKICAHKKRVLDDETNPLVSVLRLAGVTRVIDGYHRVRNRIYYRVFDREWINANMPDAELRRQRAAYRRGMARTAAVAAVILFLMAGLAFSAIREKRHADREKSIAVEERRRADEKTREVEAALIEVRQERERAVKLQAVAEDEQAEAEAQRREAEAQRKDAEAQRKEAVSQKEIAQRERAATEQQRQQTLAETRQRVVAQSAAAASAATAQTAQQAGQYVRQLLYAVQMNLAQQAWEEGNVGRVRKLLCAHADWSEGSPADPVKDACRRPPESQLAGDDLRGFEWHYLHRLTHRALSTKELKQRGAVYIAASSPPGGGGTKLAVATLAAPAPEEATAEQRYSVSVWDAAMAAGGDKPARLEVASGKIVSLALSPDGTKLLTGHAGGRAQLWDVATGKPLATLQHRDVEIRPTRLAPDIGTEIRQFETSTVAFSPDGQTLATGSGNSVKLWDAATLRQVATLAGHEGGVTRVLFSPDGQTLASGGSDNFVKLWKVPARGGAGVVRLVEAPMLSGHEADISALAFSSDGRTLAAGSTNGTTLLWDAATGKRLGPTFKGTNKQITHIAFSPRAKLFAVGGHDKAVRLWLTPERAPEAKPVDSQVRDEEGALHIRPNLSGADTSALIVPAAFSPAGPSVNLFSVTARPIGLTPGVVVVPANSSEKPPEPVAVLKGHEAAVLALAFSKDGRQLTTVGADDALKAWLVETEWTVLTSLDGNAYGLAYSPDGKLLATGKSGGTETSLKLWDAATGDEVFAAQAGLIYNVAFSPDGKLLASVGAGATLWHVAERRKLLTFGKGVFYSVAFAPRDGKILATGSPDGLVRLWDVSNGRELYTLQASAKGTPNQSQGIESLHFSTDGQFLATACHDGTLKVWETATGREVWRRERAENGLSAVAYSPDGKLVATGGAGSTIQFWDAATGAPLAELEGHADLITFITFSPDGRRLATASRDNTLRLWDVDTQQEVAALKGHDAPINNIAFSPFDGQMIATASADRTVRLWRANAKQSLSR